MLKQTTGVEGRVCVCQPPAQEKRGEKGEKPVALFYFIFVNLISHLGRGASAEELLTTEWPVASHTALS